MTAWPSDGPPLVWKRRLGTGYATCSVSRGRLFLLDRAGETARLTALKSETGENLWTFRYRANYEDMLGYNNGPRCTPVVDDDRVYIFGAGGLLHCLQVVDGRLLWKVDTAKQYNVVPNFFGVGSTPLIEGDLVIAQVGGSPPRTPGIYEGPVSGDGSGLVALNKWTGQEVYRLSDELASYASPVVATIDRQRWCLSFCRGGLLGFDPRTGAVRFHYPWRAKKLESVNASTPVVFGRSVFISETYGPGSSLLEIRGDRYRVVWSDAKSKRAKAMQTHWNTPIYHEGFLYASSGRHASGADLRCIEARTGRVAWSEKGLLRASLLYVDGHLVALSEDGTLRLIRATPVGYQEVCKAVIREQGHPVLNYPAWAAPVLAHGLLYVRGKSYLVCLELIADR
ncbi:MAG: PQQ-binding-like beta-propeller repeat protein [Pirellulales bacterium]